ncbi:hypothetical protein [Methylocystis sp. SC2]|uniref:hypothetical protein n=1 Tax=Methylocystis sp. (strain SC2) TaxID=187303 RepID=UPI000315D86A|nr:hypothetical protein [Methylocystis sp. SC2]
MLATTGFAAGVTALALTFSAAVLAAFAATARFVTLLPAAAVLAVGFAAVLAAELAAEARATLRELAAAVRRVAVACAEVLAVLSFAVDFGFVVVVFDVIVLAAFAEVFALVLRFEAAAARADFPAAAERLAGFFDADVELFAAAVFVAPLLVAPLLAARLASVLERAAEPLARAAAVEAVAGDFFSVLLEGIRGLLLCCPAVETGPSPPDESRTPSAKKPRRRREGGSWEPC